MNILVTYSMTPLTLRIARHVIATAAKLSAVRNERGRQFPAGARSNELLLATFAGSGRVFVFSNSCGKILSAVFEQNVFCIPIGFCSKFCLRNSTYYLILGSSSTK